MTISSPVCYLENPWFSQNICLAPVVYGKRTLSEKRYHVITNADLGIYEKSLAEVVGERVLAPAVKSIKAFVIFSHQKAASIIRTKTGLVFVTHKVAKPRIISK